MKKLSTPPFLQRLPCKVIHCTTNNHRLVDGPGGRAVMVSDIEERIVIVSALDETHAIVRKPNCSRYVAPIEDLKPLEDDKVIPLK